MKKIMCWKHWKLEVHVVLRCVIFVFAYKDYGWVNVTHFLSTFSVIRVKSVCSAWTQGSRTFYMFMKMFHFSSESLLQLRMLMGSTRTSSEVITVEFILRAVVPRCHHVRRYGHISQDVNQGGHYGPNESRDNRLGQQVSGPLPG